MRSMPENPLSALLSMRESRDVLPGWGLGAFLLAVVGGGLCLAYMAGGAFGGRVYTMVLSLLLLGLIPLFRAMGDGAAVTSLKRGRCFEEILGTRAGPAEVADGLVLHGMRRTVQAALPVWPLFLLVGFMHESLLLAAMWLPVMLWLTAFEGYALLALATLSGPGGRGLPFQAGVSALFLAPLVYLVILMADVMDRSGISPLAWAAAGVSIASALALAVVLARSAALWGLEEGDRLLAGFGALWRRLKGQRKPVWGGPSNPLAFREWARQRSRLSAGSLLFAAPLLLVFTQYYPTVVFESRVSCGTGRAMLAMALSLLLLALIALQTVRATLATVGAVVDERESGTLSFVALTRITPKDFLDGCAQSAWLPLAIENTMAVPVVAFVALMLRVPLSMTLAGLVLLYAAPIMGAYLGLCSSAGSFRRGEARGHAITWLVLLLSAVPAAVIGSLILVGESRVGPVAAGLLVAGTALATPAFRLVALRDLSTDGLEGLGLPPWLVTLMGTRG